MAPIGVALGSTRKRVPSSEPETITAAITPEDLRRDVTPRLKPIEAFRTDADTPPHDELRFDYLPDSPLNHGWQVSYGEPGATARWNPAPDAPTPGSMLVEMDARCAIEHGLSPSAGLCDRVLCEIRFTATTMFFVELELASHDGKTKPGRRTWIKYILSTGEPFPTRDYEKFEWTVPIAGTPLPHGWRRLEMPVAADAIRTWGRDGWELRRLLCVRIRGNLSISAIRFYQSADALNGYVPSPPPEQAANPASATELIDETEKLMATLDRAYVATLVHVDAERLEAARVCLQKLRDRFRDAESRYDQVTHRLLAEFINGALDMHAAASLYMMVESVVPPESAAVVAAHKTTAEERMQEFARLRHIVVARFRDLRHQLPSIPFDLTFEERELLISDADEFERRDAPRGVASSLAYVVALYPNATERVFGAYSTLDVALKGATRSDLYVESIECLAERGLVVGGRARWRLTDTGKAVRARLLRGD